ncbi:MAG: hypothetical protein AB7H86_22235 [Blastocatellales bacterium]
METVKQNRRFGRSVVALLTGFIVVVALSLGTDQLMHVLGVYPPWGEPMNETSDNLLALGYRTVYAIFGSYIVARLAPRNPMKHALISGAIGMVLSLLGVMAAMQMNLGPMWYPVALVITALPCAWLGGLLHGLTNR